MSAGALHDAAQEGVHVEEADYVIIGSGAGGAAAARVLAASGRSVVVLEDGPAFSREQLGTRAFTSLSTMFRHGGQMAAMGRAPVPILQGRCVGGTTFVNSAIIWRLPEKVLARWHGEFGLADGLPAKALEAAYEVIEREMHVRPVSDENASNSDRRMALGAERAGIEARTIHRSERGCQGSGRCFHGCPNDAKQSATINYLRRAIADGAHVYANAGVRRIVTRGGRATSVIGRVGGAAPESGRDFQIEARLGIVISASVVQSPNLLWKSGLGKRGRALGQHFTAHPGTSVVGIYPERIDCWTGASQGYEAYGLRDTLGVKFESINVPPEVAASRFPGAGPRFARLVERLPYMAIWAAALRADAEGSVRPSRLFNGDLVRYQLTSSDLERMRTGVRRLAEMHFLAGATEVLPGIHGLPETIGADQLGLINDAPLDPRCYSMIATHLFGTCRASSNEQDSVVDPYLRVRGIDGLHVMDASVFPTNTGVNPQHSIMAIATVAASRLAGA